MLELTKTKDPQVTVLPSVILANVKDLLEKRNISYEQVHQYDFEEGWPWGCTFRGEYYSRNIYAIVACVTPESLTKAAEDMFFMTHNEIK
jgi:hypothetical protein